MGRSETGRTGARFGASARRGGHTVDPESPHGEPAEGPEPIVATAPDDESVGLTGARFGGRARRPRTRAERAAAAGARPAGPAAPPASPPPEVALDPPPERGRPWETAPVPRLADPPGPLAGGTTRSVRPYVLTGGRTRAPMELRVETLVSTAAGPDPDVGERRSVLELCARPRSVSEVAALARVPLGVARVVIGDLVAEGRLRVHAGVDAGGPDIALLDRVLSGLRRL